jgi:hypothetical protein
LKSRRKPVTAGKFLIPNAIFFNLKNFDKFWKISKFVSQIMVLVFQPVFLGFLKKMDLSVPTGTFSLPRKKYLGRE